MARARNIKPSFFQNEKLGDLDPLTRLFFIGLWTVADFKGCLEYRPKRLRVQLVPYDLGFNLEQAVKNLEQDGFIRSYVDGEKTYLKIVNFERHQTPHKNERDSGSAIPDCPELSSQTVEIVEDTEKPEKIGLETEKIGTARADSLLLIPDSLNPLTDSLALNLRERAGDRRTAIPVDPAVPERIEEFLGNVREQYGTAVLSREDRWVDAVIKADESGISPAEFHKALRRLLADESRSFPVTPQNVLDAALESRAKRKAGPSPRLPTWEENQKAIASRSPIPPPPPRSDAPQSGRGPS